MSKNYCGSRTSVNSSYIWPFLCISLNIVTPVAIERFARYRSKSCTNCLLISSIFDLGGAKFDIFHFEKYAVVMRDPSRGYPYHRIFHFFPLTIIHQHLPSIFKILGVHSLPIIVDHPKRYHVKIRERKTYFSRRFTS